MVIAPGTEGELGILPRHAALLTTLKVGELLIKLSGAEEPLFVSGGFLEVSNNKVTVLAETPQVETKTADRNFVITSTQVTETSLNGRDWQSLLRTLPGVVSNDASPNGVIEIELERPTLGFVRPDHAHRCLPRQAQTVLRPQPAHRRTCHDPPVRR